MKESFTDTFNGCILWEQCRRRVTISRPLVLAIFWTSNETWLLWLSIIKSTLSFLVTCICLAKWASGSRKLLVFIHPDFVPSPSDSAGSLLIMWFLKLALGNMNTSGKAYSVALITLHIVTNEPCSADDSAPTCFLPFGARTLPCDWTVVIPVTSKL